MEHTIIKNKNTKEITKPFYRVDINFMGGDGDYYDDAEVIIDAKDFDKAKPFLVALETMQHAYPRGKGGDDEHNGVIEYALFFTEEPLYDFKEGCFDKKSYRGFELTEEESEDINIVEKKFEEYQNKVNPLKLCVEIPTNEYGGQYSFCGYDVTYIDEKRHEHEVKLSFNEEENKRFEEIKTLLDW